MLLARRVTSFARRSTVLARQSRNEQSDGDAGCCQPGPESNAETKSI